jgi:hypothetical protein
MKKVLNLNVDSLEIVTACLFGGSRAVCFYRVSTARRARKSLENSQRVLKNCRRFSSGAACESPAAVAIGLDFWYVKPSEQVRGKCMRKIREIRVRVFRVSKKMLRGLLQKICKAYQPTLPRAVAEYPARCCVYLI